MADTEKASDMDSRSSIELTSSLIEQLGKSFVELKAHRNVSEDENRWNDIISHLLHLESTMKEKLEEIEEQENVFTEKDSEIQTMLAEKRAAVTSKQQEMLDRVQELKDAAAAAIAEARANHPPVSFEPDGGEDGPENKVISFLDDEITLDEREFSPYNMGENPEGVDADVHPRPELTEFCEQMNAKGLAKFITENQNELPAICRELSVAFGAANEPACLVLDSLEGFFPPGEHAPGNENGDALPKDECDPGVDNDHITPEQGEKGEDAHGDAIPKKGDEGENKLRFCTVLAEAFTTFVAKARYDADTLISLETKQQAKVIADKWKPRLDSSSVDPANGNLSDAVGFFQLLGTFRIASEFDKDELLKLVLAIASHGRAPELCRSVGLTREIPGIIDTLIKNSRLVDAMNFIQVFKLSESFPPIPLLKTYLKDVRRSTQGMGRVQNEHELMALNAVITCVKKYNLEDFYPLGPLKKRVTQLEFIKSSKERQPKGRGGGKKPRPFFSKKTAHGSYSQDGGVGAPYNGAPRPYGGYMGSEVQQPPYQPYM